MRRHGGLGPKHRCRVSFPPAASPAPPALVLSSCPSEQCLAAGSSATLQTSCCLPSHTGPVIRGLSLSQEHLLKVTGWQPSRPGEEWFAVLPFLAARSWLCSGQKRCKMAAKAAQQLLHVVWEFILSMWLPCDLIAIEEKGFSKAPLLTLARQGRLGTHSFLFPHPKLDEVSKFQLYVLTPLCITLRPKTPHV